MDFSVKSNLLRPNMKKSTLLLFGVLCVNSPWVHAEIPLVTGTPTMEFKTIIPEGPSLKEHKVMPYRFYNRMIVSVWDPVACGQKATNPEFSISGNKLILSYSLSKAPENAKQCSLVSEFQIDNVPHKDLEINFSGEHEPFVVATMKKCGFYKPTSDDVWECLAPSIED